MNQRELECFLAVSEELHFGRAAERLQLSQPMVTQAIQRLEREFGAPLFDRSTRRVTLTAFGTKFVGPARAARDTFIDAREMGRRLAHEASDVLVLGYSRDSAGSLLEVVRALPKGSIELRNMITPAQLAALRRRRIHAGLGWETPADTGLATAVVTTTAFTAMVPNGHPLADRAAISIADLEEGPLIGWPRRIAPELTDLFTDAVAAGRQPSFTSTGTTQEDIAAHVLAGRGIGIGVASLIERVIDGVRIVKIADGPAVREILAWPKRYPHPLLPQLREALITHEMHGRLRKATV